MSQSQCLKIKLKPGQTDAFMTWAKTLPNRMDEVSAALKHEGIITEFMILDRAPGGDY